MTPEVAFLLLGVAYLAEWALWLYRLVRPNAGAAFA